MKTNKTRTQKSVTFNTFAVFAVIVACIIGIADSNISHAHTESEFNEGFGEITLPEDTHVCAVKNLGEGSIRLLTTYIIVVEKLIDWQEHDGPELTPEDHELGYALTSTDTCGTFSEPYKVIVLADTAGYMLFRFDPALEFADFTYITPSVSHE